jgi:hypothetical protein
MLHRCLTMDVDHLKEEEFNRRNYLKWQDIQDQRQKLREGLRNLFLGQIRL